MNQIHETKQRGNGKALLGLVLILAGAGLVARQLNMIPYRVENVLFTWQVFLILLGVVFLSSRSNRITGFILIGVGGFFIIPELLPVGFEYRKLFWPVAVIILGVVLIIGGSSWYRRSVNQGGSNEDLLDDVNIFGGHDRIVTAKNFRGGEIVSIFGGGKYDFRNAQLSGGYNELETVNIFGGSKMIVPSDWDVKIEVVAIFGGFSDKRVVNAVDTTKKLTIKGVAIFGGGDLVS